MKLYIFLIIIIIDQLTKYIVSKSLSLNSIYKFSPFLDFAYIQNTGISFGLFSQILPAWVISVVVGIIIIILIYWLFNSDKSLEKWGLMIILAGAFGNFIDRLLNNYVVDFIYFHYKHYYWPAFNIADIAITAGVVILIIATYIGYKYRLKK